MKILHIVPIYCKKNELTSFQSLGGGERYPFELVRFLTQNNLHDSVHIMLFGEKNYSVSVNGVQITVIKGVRPFKFINKSVSPFPFSIKFMQKIRWADIIHGYHIKSDTTFIAVLTSIFFRKPVVLTDLGGGGPLKIFRLLKIESLARAILCISKYDQGFWSVKNKIVIYGGVDLEKYKYKKNKDNFILYVGRIMPHKGIDRLMRALPYNLKLVIAGRTTNLSYFNYLKEVARNKNVKLIENPDDTTVIDLYRRAACFVLPSTYTDYKGKIQKKTELLGLVVLEAMASGTPVIVSDAGSLPELVINNKTGFIFEDSNTNQLAHIISTVMSNKNLREKMGYQARKHVESKFNWILVAKKVRKIYGRIVAS